MFIPINTNKRGNNMLLGGKLRRKVIVNIFAAGSLLAGTAVTYQNTAYADNLDMIQAQTVRNRLEDNSPGRFVKMDQITQTGRLGPRSEYLNSPNGNPERAFPTTSGGQNRTSCEFSHFSYDDPVVFPNKPGRAHLHMFFGNTHINAYSTYDTLVDEGSGTCNGQELNRSGYWVPAMFDGDGNVRIPERIVVYYKGEGFANGGPNGRNPTYPDSTPNAGSQKYRPGMANVAPNPLTVPEVPNFDGGAVGEFNFKCSNNFSAPTAEPDTVENIPTCDGDFQLNTFGAPYPATRTVLEMEVKFWNCFDKSFPDDDYRAWKPSGLTRGGWFFGNCSGRGGQNSAAGAPALDDKETFPSFSYFVNYVVEPGEDTSQWHLSSDVDIATLGNTTPSLVSTGAGSTHHGDAWWAWHPQTHDQWLANCVNFTNNPTASGCGFGYLTDGGPDGNNPASGPALKYRQQFDTVGQSSSYKVPASQIFNELCAPLGAEHTFSDPRHAAWCKPNS